MSSRIVLATAALIFAPLCWAQNADRMKSRTGATTIIGPRNAPLHEGAQALLGGRNEEGVRLTLQGLAIAHGRREEEAALSNLCAGYLMLKQYDDAMKYCDMLLTRNDNNWRGYNNRALIFLKTKQLEKADQDLTRGEAINPGAHTLKVARAMYLDIVNPVTPEIEIDDRPYQRDPESQQE